MGYVVGAGLAIPSTLPSGQPYTFYIDYANILAALGHGAANNSPVPLKITFDYTDVESRLVIGPRSRSISPKTCMARHLDPSTSCGPTSGWLASAR